MNIEAGCGMLSKENIEVHYVALSTENMKMRNVLPKCVAKMNIEVRGVVYEKKITEGQCFVLGKENNEVHCIVCKNEYRFVFIKEISKCIVLCLKK